MKSRIGTFQALICILAALTIPVRAAGQEGKKKGHHHYILKDLGTLGGPKSTGTEFQQILNDRGAFVGGADTLSPNPYPNCFNPFNFPVECNVQHAFEWRDGELIDLGTLLGGSGSSSFAYFITGNGLTVGGSENGVIDPLAGTPEFHAVLWQHGRIMDLGTLGGTSSDAFQANNQGQVIGFAQNAIIDRFSLAGLGTQTRGFVWQNGIMQDLGTLGGPDTFAQVVNEMGEVAGVSYTSDIPDPNTGVPPLDPFLWEHGQMKDLGNFGGTNGFLGPFIFGLNNRGEVVGTMALPGDQFNHAFVWNGEKLSDLGTFGGNFSFASGINDAGVVIGAAWFPGDVIKHAFLWTNGVMTDLGTAPGDLCSVAQSINSRGQVVGASQDANCDPYTHAFLWENGGPSVDLNTLIPPNSAVRLASGGWINDRGEIGAGGVPSGCGNGDICGHAFLLIPCDQDHPDLEGCDYDPVDDTIATDVRAAQANKPSAATASDNQLSPVNWMSRYRFWTEKHHPRFSAPPRP
jgi:probable HAF family extracellular repeat protein